MQSPAYRRSEREHELGHESDLAGGNDHGHVKVPHMPIPPIDFIGQDHDDSHAYGEDLPGVDLGQR